MTHSIDLKVRSNTRCAGYRMKHWGSAFYANTINQYAPCRLQLSGE